MTCGLYREIREFGRMVDPFFKTTAIDHSAIPPQSDYRSESRVLRDFNADAEGGRVVQRVRET